MDGGEISRRLDHLLRTGRPAISPDCSRKVFARVADKARDAVTLWSAWLDADGLFPDPMYDDLMSAMEQLSMVIAALPPYHQSEER